MIKALKKLKKEIDGMNLSQAQMEMIMAQILSELPDSHHLARDKEDGKWEMFFAE